MRSRVNVREQVKVFLEILAPQSRGRITLALHGPETEHGDGLAPRESLSGYHRIKTGGYGSSTATCPDRPWNVSSRSGAAWSISCLIGNS